MVRDPHLPADYDTASNHSAAGNARLRGNDGIFADLDVVGNLNEIINLGAVGDAGSVQSAAIHCRIGANLDVIAYFDSSNLREFPIAAFSEDVAEAIRADNCSRVNDDAAAELDPSVKRNARIEVAILPDR